MSLPVDSVTGLDAPEEHFAQLVASGTSQSDARRQAYNVAPSSLDKTNHEEASRIANRPKVAARIQQIRESFKVAVAASQAWTLDRLVGAAEEHRQTALTGGFRGVSAANGALEIIGRVTGLLSDRPRVELPPIITRITVVLNHGRDAEGREQVTETSYKVLEPGLEVVPSMENPQQTRETPENVQG